ncbi:hypothetical protein [Sinorhizobium sp. GL28]|uniref:hypothetical protein n=1 Tax=Sinorhizobium sp. GL28 TaxID=1358418 RepID=UPI00072AF3B2|nr:hypothetical protein [Sinorhizobium sp. GL28]KSV83717.1 hypothetical protein N184_34535 [Sinorhizobium sp. GL28]
MNRCQPKKVTYRARSYLRASGIPRYLMSDGRWPLWHWTKDAERQEEFRNYGELIDAIVKAGGPDENNRRVIIETDTHEEKEFSASDHARWQRERAGTAPSE